MKHSRLTNSFYNFISSVGGQFLTILLQFIVRTVFIKNLGNEYLGINGLFSNILQMLSLAELGIGSAILFKLYKPIVTDNRKRIIVLMNFYKRVYQVIGVTITVIGLSLIPFLKLIVSDYNKLEFLGINAVLVYLLYLLKSVVSYFFLAYKSAIIKADQKEYKINTITYVVTLISSITQIISLYLFKSFETYVLIQILAVLLSNYLNARLAKKMYPYIDDVIDEKISKEEKKEIFKDCGALFLYKINTVVLKATDNIVISMFLGLNMVGMYSNYYLFYNTLDTVFNKIFDSIKHSLGNLHASNSSKREYLVFKTVNLIAVIFGAIVGIGIACASNEFVSCWLGDKWIIAQPFSILLGIEVYGLASRKYLARFRSSMGLFQQGKIRPIFGMIINIVASILLVNKLGISGVLLGTIIADWTTLLWFDPYIILKYGLGNKRLVYKYYIKNLLNLLLTFATGAICYLICNNLLVNLGWISVIIHAIIIIIIVLIMFVIFYYKSDEFVEVKRIINRFTRKILKKVKHA